MTVIGALTPKHDERLNPKLRFPNLKPYTSNSLTLIVKPKP